MIILVIIILYIQPPPPVVKGGWSDWKVQKECDTSACGVSKSSRIEKRFCNNPAPSNKGAECVGSESRETPCETKECPINGGWSDWRKLSETCGDNGVYNEIRTCTNPSSKYGGEDCQGDNSRVVSCTSDVNQLISKKDVIDGGWSEWTTGKCSAECGSGKVLLSRTCNNPLPQNGGKECSGDSTVEMDCNSKDCPVDGGWSEWEVDESSCSKECGSGYKYETRKCNNPLPQNGGKECQGVDRKLSDTKCNLKKCPLSEKECNSLVKGPYPKECLGVWFRNVTCTNESYIENYPKKYQGGGSFESGSSGGWWHTQEPEIVKQDMRNWAINPFWGTQFKSICLPKNYIPQNKEDCNLSNSFWDKSTKKCDITMDKRRQPKN